MFYCLIYIRTQNERKSRKEYFKKYRMIKVLKRGFSLFLILYKIYLDKLLKYGEHVMESEY